MRNFTVVQAEQRSPAWKQARAGRLTASRARDMLAPIKSGEAAARRDLRVQLVVERLTGEPQDSDFVNADMQRGMDLEAEAFSAYESVTGQMATRCGFVAHDDLLIGCSPDGVIDDFGGIVELKVPRSATHLRYLRAGTIPPEHLPQLLHALWVTGAAYCDFLSYDPRFPSHLQTFYTRVMADPKQIADYAAKAMAFLEEVERDVLSVRTMADVGAQMRAVVA
jgi:hypothetical protein